MLEQNIACPNCKNPILFNVHDLLQGVAFSCSQCDVKIQLPGQNSELVSESLQEFNSMIRKSIEIK